MSKSQASGARRFLAVDALRGIAALAVVFYHIQAALDRGEQPWMPESLRALFHGGHFGVNVFFVLSGFVIAYSVRDGAWTPGYLARFAARRSIRLDPPYWAAIALEIVLILLGLALFPSLATPLPGMAQIAAHLLYLQDILGYGHFIPIFWTLCYEFQFYLVFVGMLVAFTALRRRTGRLAATVIVSAAFGLLFLASIGAHHGYLSSVPRGLALDRWHEFFVGVLAWWVVSGVIRFPVLLIAWAVMFGVAAHPDAAVELPITILTSATCIASATMPAFDRRFSLRPLQFLGATSYSLYLYHASIGWRVVSLAQAFVGRSLPFPLGLATWMAALGASVFTAWLGWRVLEQPSVAFARRIRLPRHEDAPSEAISARGAA